MSASQSQAGPSTAVEESTPLLSSTDAPSNGTSDRTEGASREDEAAEGPTVVYRSLSDINKFLSRLFIAVIVTGVIQLVFTLTALILNQYGSSRFDLWDYDFVNSLSPFSWASLFGVVLALYNVLLLRRSGRPAYLLVNILVFGLGGCVLAVLGVANIVNRAGGDRGPDCRRDIDDDYSWYPGSYAECLEWIVGYDVVIWIYLVLSLILGLEYVVLFVSFFVKLYKERSSPASSSSSSTWRIPAGYLSFEVRVNWGSPQSAERVPSGDAPATAATAQARRDEESGPGA